MMKETALNTKRLFFSLLIFLVILSLINPAFSLSRESSQKVIVAQVDGVIEQTVSSYIQKVIDKAEKEDAVVLIEMDTPGGLDKSMRVIIKDILSSRVPVIVYVYPSGARAASAGCFITYASHIAAMTPGTNIGAAHPVSMGGQQIDETMAEKVTNDAVAYIKSLAKKRNRNQEWAEKAVRESKSITAEEALERNVIDLIANNRAELLEKIDGMTVSLEDGKYTFDLSPYRIEEMPMSWLDRLFHTLANPNIAYILLMFGFYGIIYEFANPGIGFAGIGGAICLILGFYGLHTLPVNYAGLALMILGLILFIAEAFTPTFGVLAGGGVISFVIGSLLLFESSLPALKVSLTVVLPVTAITVALVLIVVGAAIRAHRKKVSTGTEGMAGLVGMARTKLDPTGQVFVRGELWKAEAINGPIEKNARVEVVEVAGLKLKVRKVK